jgi:hypothetical protein
MPWMLRARCRGAGDRTPSPPHQLTWADLLRPAPARPRIIITPWAVNVPILARGEVPAWFEDRAMSGDAVAEPD